MEKFFAFVEATGTYMFRLYEKQIGGTYLQIHNKSLTAGGGLYYVAEDGSFAIIRGNKLMYLIKCDIINCIKCSWINKC